MKAKIRTRILKMAMFLGMFTIVFIAQGNNNKAFAKSKKYVYITSLVKTVNKKAAFGQCNKFVLKGKKLTIKASLKKAKSENAYFDGRYKSLKYKKRTFKLAKGCKFYECYGEPGTKRVGRKRFIRSAKYYNGLGLLIFTNKKGKVYKIEISV